VAKLLGGEVSSFFLGGGRIPNKGHWTGRWESSFPIKRQQHNNQLSTSVGRPDQIPYVVIYHNFGTLLCPGKKGNQNVFKYLL